MIDLRPHPESDGMTGEEIRAAIVEAEEQLVLARQVRDAGGDDHVAWFAQEIRGLQAALARRNGSAAASIIEDLPEPAAAEQQQVAFPAAAWSRAFVRWRDVVAPCTEAALENLWAALLVAAGMVLGRNAWRESPQPLYPNFYLLLLGATGDSRKSTVLWLLRELLEHVSIKFQDLAGVASVEGIYEALAIGDATKALIYNDEFRALLAVGKRQSTQNLLPRLNSLYYCPRRDSIQRVKDSTMIIEPFVSLVAATPRAYIDDILSELEVSGGFLNRFLIVSGSEQPPKPVVRAPSTAAWESVAAPLRAIGERFETSPGHFEFTPDAERLWCQFYIAWKNERRSWAQRMTELTARCFEHILKIAIIYAALDGETRITGDALARAIAVGEWLQSNTLSLFGDAQTDRLGQCERALLDVLKRAKDRRAWRRDLQQTLSKRGYNAETFNRAIKALEGNDQVYCNESITAAGRTRKIVELAGTGNT